LDAILGKLIEMLAVKGRPGVRGDVDRAQPLAGRRIDRVQRPSGRKPDVLTVVGDAMHVVDSRKGSVLADNLGF
jgi:hypothetical protein